MSKTLNDEHWLNLITQCRSSGLTDRQWCIENGVPVSTFYYHIRTLRKKVCEVPKAVDAISLGFIPLPKSGIDELCIAGYNECT